jgi:hypothetical protein
MVRAGTAFEGVTNPLGNASTVDERRLKLRTRRPMLFSAIPTERLIRAVKLYLFRHLRDSIPKSG